MVQYSRFGCDARLALQSVQGVAEVASIGGFEKQYQVIVDPNRLQSFGVSLMDVMEAIRNNNNEAGGRLVEFSGREFMVRARGYVKSADELARVAVKASPGGTPVRFGSRHGFTTAAASRGVADYNGMGDTVGDLSSATRETRCNVMRARKGKIER